VGAEQNVLALFEAKTGVFGVSNIHVAETKKV
jgi:hypothetical protein